MDSESERVACIATSLCDTSITKKKEKIERKLVKISKKKLKNVLMSRSNTGLGPGPANGPGPRIQKK
jgi:hypothetical protein